MRSCQTHQHNAMYKSREPAAFWVYRLDRRNACMVDYVPMTSIDIMKLRGEEARGVGGKIL